MSNFSMTWHRRFAFETVALMIRMEHDAPIEGQRD
jgi:hypothetical protein